MLGQDSAQLDDRLTFVDKPLSVLSTDIRQLHFKDICVVEVQWRYCKVIEAT